MDEAVVAEVDRLIDDLIEKQITILELSRTIKGPEQRMFFNAAGGYLANAQQVLERSVRKPDLGGMLGLK